MTNIYMLSNIAIFIGCMTLGAVYAWLLYNKIQPFSKLTRISLATFRTLVVGLILYLCFAPSIRKKSYILEKPIIIIAQDNSHSTKIFKPKNFNSSKYEADLKKLRSQLQEHYEVRTYSFGDSVRKGLRFDANENSSDATALFKQINNEYANRNLGAIIFASDGIFNRGGNPTFEINKNAAPIYSIALSDTTSRKDISISNINYNNLVYLNNNFNIEVQVEAYESKGETSKLRIYENGKIIAENLVNINKNSFVQDYSFKLKAAKKGIHRYEIVLSPLENELTIKNNKQGIFIEAIDGKQQVLIAATAPHPDLATLKQSVESNANFSSNIVFPEQLDTVNLKKYQLIINYQLPSLNNAASYFFSQITKLQKPIWHIIGMQSNIAQFNTIQDLLTFSKSNQSIQEVYPVYNPYFAPFKVDEEYLTQFAQYPPLLAPFSTMQINGNFSSLLNQKIGNISTKNPLWLFSSNNNIKSAYLIGEGLWRWKLEEAKHENNISLSNLLISKTVQNLTAKDDKRKFQVYTNKKTYENQEPILLNANLYNDNLELTSEPDVFIKLKNEEGKIFNYTLPKVNNAYQLRLDLLPKGTYTFDASTKYTGKELKAEGAFFINESIIEFQQAKANHQLLNTISKEHLGKMYLPEQITSIYNDIKNNEKIKTVSFEEQKDINLISLAWIFGLIVVLLSTEWFLRKYKGAI